MISNLDLTDISKQTKKQTKQGSATEWTESTANADQFQQYPTKMKSHNKYRSPDEKYSQPTSQIASYLALHVPLFPISSYQHDDEQVLNNGLNVMVMGPEAYRKYIKENKLFETFRIPYKSTRNDLINEIFKVEELQKDPPTIYVVYGIHLLGNEIPSKEQLEYNAVLYVLLIPPFDKSREAIEDSFDFDYPKNFAKSSDVLIRVHTQNQNTETEKCRILRIKNPPDDVSIGELVQNAFEQLEECPSCSYKIYYHTQELPRHMHPLQKNCNIPIDKERTPVIFDLVFTRSEQATPSLTTQNDSQNYLQPKFSIDTASIHKIQMLEDDEHQENSNVRYDTVSRKFYFSYAYSLYTRLLLHSCIQCSQQTKFKNGLANLNSTLEADRISDLLLNFYYFCDKDKSAMLDEREWTIGLLTLLKYIDDGENKLTPDILLPIVYSEGISNSKKENVCDINDFRTLIIDTLTEHLRLQIFGYMDDDPETSEPKNLTQEIDRISENLRKTLTKHLQRKKVEDPSPFNVKGIFKHIILFILCFAFLPFVVLYTILKTIPKSKHPSTCKTIIGRLIIILSSIIVALAACIVYLITINIILYYVYYSDSTQWHVSALEVYWPLALMICIYLIAYVYGTSSGMNEDYKKNTQLKEFYRQAELDLLKHKAVVTVMKSGIRSRRIMADWESQQENERKKSDKETKKDKSSGTKRESDKRNKKNYWYKLFNLLNEIYQTEKKESNRSILFKIIGLFIILGIAVVHAFVPTIYRAYSKIYTYPTNVTKPFYVHFIETSYIVLNIILFLIFSLVIVYAYYLYHQLSLKLNRVIERASNNDKYVVMSKNTFHLDLRDQYNLDLFLALVRDVLHLKNKIEYKLAIASITCALLLDFILGLVAFVRLVMYSVGFGTLTGTFILINIIILSIIIVVFLIGIGTINTTATTTVYQLLTRTKKEILNDVLSFSPLEKQAKIIFLSAMLEELVINRNLYVVSILRLVVDIPLITRIILSLIGQIIIAVLAVVKKDLTSE